MKDGKIIYTGGKAIVNDYNETRDPKINTIEYEYQDNIEEIIKIENVIEELENLKKKLEDKIDKRNATINFYSKMKKILIWSVIAISVLGSILLSVAAFTNGRFNLINSILFGTISSTSLSSLFYSYFIFSSISEKTKAAKEKNGYELELEELEKELIKSKDQLSKLKFDKTKNNQKEKESIRYVDIHNIHLDELREIRDHLILYYQIGENEKKWLKYYNEGTLAEKLNELYYSKDIEKVKTYFRSKKSTI